MSGVYLKDPQQGLVSGMEAKMDAKNPLFFGLIDLLLAVLALVSAAALLASL